MSAMALSSPARSQQIADMTLQYTVRSPYFCRVRCHSQPKLRGSSQKAERATILDHSNANVSRQVGNGSQTEVGQPPADAGLALAATLWVGAYILLQAEPSMASTLDPQKDASQLLDLTPATLALLPPQASEFWDNVGRFVVYFFTVLTGGFLSLVQPIIDRLRNPSSAVLVIVALAGGLFLAYTTLAAMLGLNPSDTYEANLYG